MYRPPSTLIIWPVMKSLSGVIRNTIAGRVIKRDMVPDDLIGAIVFLMTPDSDFITGQMINVDGGRYMY